MKRLFFFLSGLAFHILGRCCKRVWVKHSCFQLASECRYIYRRVHRELGDARLIKYANKRVDQ